MLVLLIVIFIGFLNHFRDMYFNAGDSDNAPTIGPSPISRWCVTPMWFALAPLLVFGVWWPNDLWEHFMAAARLLTGPAAMTDIRTATSLRPAELKDAAAGLLASGGRMQMAYAWYPEPRPDRTALRRKPCRRGAVRGLALRRQRADSESRQCRPLLSWYEREITDLVRSILCQSSATASPGAARGRRIQATTIRPGLSAGSAVAHFVHIKQIIPEIAGAEADVQLLPFGPVRADVLESAEFLFFYVGEAIIHYHPRLFFKHRGMEKRFEALEPERGVVLAERVSGVGSVAHALAYCQAVEAASQCVVPPRAKFLRVLLAEMERLYNHLHYFGHLCHTTTLKVGEAEGKLLEEQAKQLNTRLTGSRFLRSLLAPGGLRRDLSPKPWLGAELAALRERFSRYAEHMENTASHLDRLITTGKLDRRLAFDQGATGPIERASGIDRDLRRDHPYAAYAEISPTVAVREAGDAHARAQVRMDEVDCKHHADRARARCIAGRPGSHGL